MSQNTQDLKHYTILCSSERKIYDFEASIYSSEGYNM